ncbi:hypothetical protein ANN_02176 [Periplaneta americana]|uniref:Reverse transcriptase domain-containing protein n=1 Tax=Periplaneta americana TaxID=6978 RepID=A0ABQ8TVJ1_PERAM|nr:hypothetical protein ANN_02176 [Periplaneta americana]
MAGLCEGGNEPAGSLKAICCLFCLRLRWAGHVARMGESRNAYRVLLGSLEGKRPLGKQRRTWEDNIKMHLREVGYDDREWINLAQDRDQWRPYVSASGRETRVKTGEEISEGNGIGRGVRQGCPSSPTLFNIYLEDLVKNCFQNMRKVVVGGRRIKCIRFADDMTLLAEEDTILKDMLLKLNDSCEQYGMKINANKRNTMIIERKVKKINLRILNKAVEQMGSFKYLGYTIGLSSNMSCCQDVKRRKAMAKEAFNSNRSIFCGSLEK